MNIAVVNAITSLNCFDLSAGPMKILNVLAAGVPLNECSPGLPLSQREVMEWLPLLPEHPLLVAGVRRPIAVAVISSLIYHES